MKGNTHEYTSTHRFTYVRNPLAETCMNKRTATFKTLLAKYKKLEAEHKALVADRQSQTGDNAQIYELLKRVAEIEVPARRAAPG